MYKCQMLAELIIYYMTDRVALASAHGTEKQHILCLPAPIDGNVEKWVKHF